MNLTLNHVKKRYEGFQLDYSMCLPEGRIVGFVGPNGAGKSTVIKILLGIIRPDAGEIKLDGKTVTCLDADIRQRVGVVLPDSGVCGYFTIMEIHTIMQKIYKDFQKQEFLELCQRFQLPLDKKVREFSTGMKAKLHLLLAISHHAELLILDEPTTGLDVIARDEMIQILRDYMENEGRSILISSHISSDLEEFCDEIYMIAKGSCLLHEDTDILLSEYGILKVTEEQYREMDKRYIIARELGRFGYRCLTNQVRFYRECVPGIVIEKCTIDDVIELMIRGDRQ